MVGWGNIWESNEPKIIWELKWNDCMGINIAVVGNCIFAPAGCQKQYFYSIHKNSPPDNLLITKAVIIWLCEVRASN